MNLSDYIILLEDRLEEDMRGEYGVDLLRVSKEYLMMYAGDLQQNPVGMTYCHNGKCSSNRRNGRRTIKTGVRLIYTA